MVFRAKRDPESSPAEGGIQAILDSGACPGPNLGFAGMTELSNISAANNKQNSFPD
jgi:hypothetical protein